MGNLVVVAGYGEANFHRWDLRPEQTILLRTDMPSEVPANQIATPYQGYDTGAYLWAYWNVDADKYLFVQDSLVPLTEDFAEPFFRELDTHPVVAWVGFPFFWDNEFQEIATRFHLKSIAKLDFGIFGPIFAATREALDTLTTKKLLPTIPNFKVEQQAQERAWAIAFKEAELPVGYLHISPLSDLAANVAGNGCMPFTKEFAHRP
jgi:hypothetical protein